MQGRYSYSTQMLFPGSMSLNTMLWTRWDYNSVWVRTFLYAFSFLNSHLRAKVFLHSVVSESPELCLKKTSLFDDVFICFYCRGMRLHTSLQREWPLKWWAMERIAMRQSKFSSSLVIRPAPGRVYYNKDVAKEAFHLTSLQCSYLELQSCFSEALCLNTMSHSHSLNHCFAKRTLRHTLKLLLSFWRGVLPPQLQRRKRQVKKGKTTFQ